MRKIICISGFLGHKSDWDFLDSKLFSPIVVLPTELEGGLTEAAQKINQIADKEKAQWILGYSMGGRLALHSLLSKDYKGAVIFSSQIEMDEGLKAERFKNDLIWAEKFKRQPWGEVVGQWNSQSVFKDSHVPPREEKAYNREQLASVLERFSAGSQSLTYESIKKINTPVLFVAGEWDEKYKNIGKKAAQLNSKFKLWIAPNSGHRVIFDEEQKALNQNLVEFME